ncbi:hypothetical protein EOW77_0033745 [Bradyrhizobium yuanmingense]|uniref:hypothetical protein n=1 Tax=Bradyrhizobium yuanmingense TaxID=108015 RepID=UPI000FE305D8|nr:hypothetical protein [Bradyrhizobium yuanmingense]TGN74455.1 hypothetical protein EOW77_0033745 [Bradyrhizobium yuanmingense]
MRQYSPEQAAAEIARSRETFRRVDQMFVDKSYEQISGDNEAEGNCTHVGDLPPVEPLNMRHRREIAEQERRFEAERESERAAQECIMRERTEIAASASTDQRIAELENDLVELARATSTVADALEHELSRVTRENLELKTALAKTEARLTELELRLVSAGAVVDLPSLPLGQVN